MQSVYNLISPQTERHKSTHF